LRTRFSDVLEQRKAPERARLLEELPPLLREQVFSIGYAATVKRHRFFGLLMDQAVGQMCVQAHTVVYVRGEVVQQYRMNYVDMDSETKAIRFLF
jgi:hypothetical protein